MQRDKILAIDFDGTIYDKRSKALIPLSDIALNKLYQNGYTLVLWTCRSGRNLQNAKNILKKYNLLDLFYCINETPDFIKYKVSNKCCARYYIDDRNIGGFLGWERILKVLNIE